MRRRRSNRREDAVYKSDVYSYSTYPRVRIDREESTVKPGNVYEVRILDVDDRGRGVGRVGSVRITIPQATVGDIVKVKILKVRGFEAQGEVLEWIGRAR